jgi:peptide/nickel transport system substrate-binding protein
MRRPLARSLGLTSILLTLAACGGGSDTGSQGAAPTAQPAGVQPLAGVPAGTNPLPLPELGKAYNNPQPRDNVRDGGTLTLPIPELGPQFNQFHVDSTAYVQRMMTWLAPQLWTYSVTGGVAPNPDFLLSAELLSENPETVKFTLNPNAKWNDGTPIDWTAFEATRKIQSGEDQRYAPNTTVGYSSIASVAKGEKDNEVIVVFKAPLYPYEFVFAQLAHPKNVDPEFFKSGWIDNLNPDLLAGPLTVESLTEERLTLKRNPKWWGDPAKLDEVVYVRMEDMASINAFQNGEIDATGVGTADRLKQISGMTGVQIRRGFITSTAVYTMGRDSDLFKEDSARRAFVLGTDRELLLKIRYQGMDWKEEAPGSVLMFPWQDGYRDNIADLHYDPQQARKLLDEAGWAMGDDGYRHKGDRTAEFTYVTFGDDPVTAALARAQQKMSQDIGLKMNIETRKSADYSTTMSRGNYDVVIMAWAASDPFGYVQGCQLFCKDSASNYPRIGNAALDAKLNLPGTIPDRARSMQAGNEAEAEALHFFGTFPLFNGPEQIVVKEGLANYGPDGFASPDAKSIGWQKNAQGP